VGSAHLAIELGGPSPPYGVLSVNAICRLTLSVCAVTAVMAVSPANAIHPRHWHATKHDAIARYYAAQRPWHGPYAYTPWGMALGGAADINVTPYWPSHTDQLGVYPVRGPW
jgi:hypothetical protein